MSKPTIVTLCLTCKRQYEEAGFTVKTYPGPSTTKKKTKENDEPREQDLPPKGKALCVLRRDRDLP